MKKGPFDSKWYEHGKMWQGDNPPLTEWRRDLGEGKDGYMWICSCRYRMQERKFLVAFDYETEEQSAFLKDEVVDSENYWKAHHRVYHSKFVNYEQINNTVKEFMAEHGIE